MSLLSWPCTAVVIRTSSHRKLPTPNLFSPAVQFTFCHRKVSKCPKFTVLISLVYYKATVLKDALKWTTYRNNFTFRVPCIVNVFQSMTNKMQRYAVFYFSKLLYMFRVYLRPIIRSTILYLQHLVFVKSLLLPAAIVEVLEPS